MIEATAVLEISANCNDDRIPNELPIPETTCCDESEAKAAVLNVLTCVLVRVAKAETDKLAASEASIAEVCVVVSNDAC